MKARAISFTPEVLKAKLRALEEHGQCMTRRPVISNLRAHPVNRVGALMNDGQAWVDPGGWVKPPLGSKGQRLWVRERARVVALDVTGAQMRIRYETDGEYRHVQWPDRIVGAVVGRCIPSGVHREGARHFLEVVEVRAERVVEISEQDALLDGIQRFGSEWTFNGGSWLERTPVGAFLALYDSIYGAGAHAWNWCWVYTLKRTEP